jgi:hypothetical protein
VLPPVPLCLTWYAAAPVLQGCPPTGRWQRATQGADHVCGRTGPRRTRAGEAASSPHAAAAVAGYHGHVCVVMNGMHTLYSACHAYLVCVNFGCSALHGCGVHLSSCSSTPSCHLVGLQHWSLLLEARQPRLIPGLSHARLPNSPHLKLISCQHPASFVPCNTAAPISRQHRPKHLPAPPYLQAHPMLLIPCNALLPYVNATCYGHRPVPAPPLLPCPAPPCPVLARRNVAAPACQSQCFSIPCFASVLCTLCACAAYSRQCWQLQTGYAGFNLAHLAAAVNTEFVNVCMQLHSFAWSLFQVCRKAAHASCPGGKFAEAARQVPCQATTAPAPACNTPRPAGATAPAPAPTPSTRRLCL